MTFGNPWAWVLVPIVMWIFWQWLAHRRGTTPGIPVSDFSSVADLADRPAMVWERSRPWVRWGAIVLLLAAIVRPQWHHQLVDVAEPGVDIVVAMDVSGSMAAEDFAPNNRLMAAKTVAKEFVMQRPNDRIGMVVFGTYALTQCPLTLDKTVLVDLINRIELGQAGQDTALGLGLGTAVNRLKSSHAKSKVIILLTDGVNNSGGISPEAGAKFAIDYGIKVYTIGIGKLGGAPIPIVDEHQVKTYEKNDDGSLVLTEIDEDALRLIAKQTGGTYFRATDSKSLKTIYATIDSLEKTPPKLHLSFQTVELFPMLLLGALILVMIELIGSYVVWRVAP